MQERPGLVTAIGIMTIIVGSLGLLLYCMCSIRVLILLSPEARIADLRTIPGYVPMAVIAFMVNMVLSSLFLTGGIGLLLMGQWARILTLVSAFLSLTMQLATVIYTLVVVRPALARLPRNLFREVGLFFDDQSEVVLPVAIGAVELIYAIMVIIILLLPGVGTAFADADRYGTRGRYGDGGGYRPPPPRRYRDDEDW